MPSMLFIYLNQTICFQNVFIYWPANKMLLWGFVRPTEENVWVNVGTDILYLLLRLLALDKQ